MKRFFLPSIYGENRQKKDGNGYAFFSSKVYPWTEGRFVVQMSLDHDTQYKTHNSVPMPIYIASNELTPVFTAKNQLHGDAYGLVSRDENSIFYLPVASPFSAGTPVYLTIPELNDSGIVREFKDLRTHFKAPFGGERALRVDDTALISGLPDGSAVMDYRKIFLKGIEIKKSEVAIINFNNQSFDVKVMKIASEWWGSVVSLAISLDKLTACALVANDYEPWEVVVWDLDQ